MSKEGVSDHRGSGEGSDSSSHHRKSPPKSQISEDYIKCLDTLLDNNLNIQLDKIFNPDFSVKLNLDSVAEITAQLGNIVFSLPGIITLKNVLSKSGSRNEFLSHPEVINRFFKSKQFPIFLKNNAVFLSKIIANNAKLPEAFCSTVVLPLIVNLASNIDPESDTDIIADISTLWRTLIVQNIQKKLARSSDESLSTEQKQENFREQMILISKLFKHPKIGSTLKPVITANIHAILSLIPDSLLDKLHLSRDNLAKLEPLFSSILEWALSDTKNTALVFDILFNVTKDPDNPKQKIDIIKILGVLEHILKIPAVHDELSKPDSIPREIIARSVSSIAADRSKNPKQKELLGFSGELIYKLLQILADDPMLLTVLKPILTNIGRKPTNAFDSPLSIALADLVMLLQYHDNLRQLLLTEKNGALLSILTSTYIADALARPSKTKIEAPHTTASQSSSSSSSSSSSASAHSSPTADAMSQESSSTAPDTHSTESSHSSTDTARSTPTPPNEEEYKQKWDKYYPAISFVTPLLFQLVNMSIVLSKDKNSSINLLSEVTAIGSLVDQYRQIPSIHKEKNVKLTKEQKDIRKRKKELYNKIIINSCELLRNKELSGFFNTFLHPLLSASRAEVEAIITPFIEGTPLEGKSKNISELLSSSEHLRGLLGAMEEYAKGNRFKAGFKLLRSVDKLELFGLIFMVLKQKITGEESSEPEPINQLESESSLSTSQSEETRPPSITPKKDAHMASSSSSSSSEAAKISDDSTPKTNTIRKST